MPTERKTLLTGEILGTSTDRHGYRNGCTWTVYSADYYGNGKGAKRYLRRVYFTESPSGHRVKYNASEDGNESRIDQFLRELPATAATNCEMEG